ncbi:exodeoxyribonuclease VII large subunit [Marinicauda algicola]|uniref:Exodeoxyribonuclease 7 large subunit n=1 Tax=Marinicauda algicola TaxID=2029849 RepID=A0A4V3RXY3_9PROT|nr:exodeoxyribonuclease VII large subunit [Marinicauda algicola]TGY88319.1 exodeoxyribonuclease VII large subunit [Marinicauda algicola]
MALVSNTPEFTVSELSRALKKTVEDAYGHVRVRGELGRVTVAKSGHVYLDLKDESAVIDGVMWKGMAAALGFRPEEGLEVIAEGRLSTFPGRSKYQIIIDRMEPAGAGALMALLEERKKKLAAEGLFAAERKQPIPFLPRTIGVVTSPTGAVIRDILHRLEDRFGVHVLLWPVLVQGEKAAEQIAQAIEGFNALPEGGEVPRPDVLIVARGGGSIEDLWCFNEEIVVRAAAASAIPLISAVGHETDTTLIDYASDRRAPTPTGAAEIAVPVRRELIDRVETAGSRLAGALRRAVDRKRADLSGLSRALPRPETLIADKAQRFDFARQRFESALKVGLERKRGRLETLAAGLRPAALHREIQLGRRRLAEIGRRLQPAYGRQLRTHTRELASLGARLESLSYRNVLSRGFALVRDEAGKVVREGAALSAGQGVSLTFADTERRAVIDGAEAPGTLPSGPKPARTSKPKAKPASAPSKPPEQGNLF